MKILIIKTGLLVLITAFTLSSCTKNNTFFSSTEHKLQGLWKFDKVKFQKNFNVSCTDLTAEYKNLVLEFKNDFSITRTNLITGEQSQGFWKLVTKWIYYTENPQAVKVLEGYLIKQTTGQLDSFKWENLAVTKNKITATEYKDGGTYRYILVKL